VAGDGPTTLERWHAFVATRDVSVLDEILAEDVTFRPPTYWKARHGKAETLLVLGTVVTVFEDFRYGREWVDERDWALEFTARVGELELKGVDLVRLDDDGLICDFEVVARPPNAVAALRAAMEERLAPFLQADR
jgi:hypothetical protein